MNVSTHVYMSVFCVHSLSVGDVRAVKQKPSLGFCLAGGFMQLSILKKGRALLDFLRLKKTYFVHLLWYTSLPPKVCIHLMVKLTYKNIFHILQLKMRGHHTSHLEARYVVI